MSLKLSQRLVDIVNALPLKPGMRVLEIGCGSGAAAIEVSKRIRDGYLLAIDRSEKAITLAAAKYKEQVASGRIHFKKVRIEEFESGAEQHSFDLAFAIRVGALDGRHPEIEQKALENIVKALKANGRLFIDGGNPLKEISLDKFRKKRSAYP